MRRFTLFLGASTLFALPACGSGSNVAGDAGTDHCLASLDDYCVHASPICVSHVDRSRVVASFCSQLPAVSQVQVDPLDCVTPGGVGVTIGISAGGNVFTQRTYVYDAQGNLITVFEAVVDLPAAFGACVAGPPALTRTLCTNWAGPQLTERYTCALDAGMVDALSE
jgi:hypothetical protein